MATLECDHCGCPVPVEIAPCPHCAGPLFPNVRAALVPERRAALEQRYQEAMAAASSSGCRERVEELEEATASSRAVITRPLAEIERLANSDRELYATFYELRAVRLPIDDEWNTWRRIADEALFPGYKEHVRFAALTLGATGLSSYGECSVVLRESFIAHRASVFEENSTLLMRRHHYKEPPGVRATWAERGKLCVAKLAGEVDLETQPETFGELLLRQGINSAADRFVEVHVWGPMTSRTFECVTVDLEKVPEKPPRATLKALRERLENAGVRLEVVS